MKWLLLLAGACGLALGVALGAELALLILGLNRRFRTALGYFMVLVQRLKSNADDQELLARLLAALAVHASGNPDGFGWCPHARQEVRRLIAALEQSGNEASNAAEVAEAR